VDYLREAGVVHALAHPMYGMPGPLDRDQIEDLEPNASPPPEDGFHFLRRVATLPVPLYEDLRLGVPSLLDVLDHVAEEDYDVLHVATPGPLGLAALVAGLTLNVPVVGAYHTEFGAYARALSGDAFVAEIVEVAVREFYERCSAVAVPSQATALALRNRGYRIRHFEVLKNGVDKDLFAPDKRDPALHHSLGGGRTLLLYAGRLSREKGLGTLAAGYLALRRRREDVHLVMAGDGPYRKDLEVLLGASATFTGFLRGEELARVFASCDIFVFPSTTDTLGRAVAEAQASGLPAIVCGAGGPGECIRPGVSGFVAGDDEEFFARVEYLLDDARARDRMGRAASSPRL
jgi:glycosyltransferase involved in cell wall biosynthesis